jgi:hypothetical protein
MFNLEYVGKGKKHKVELAVKDKKHKKRRRKRMISYEMRASSDANSLDILGQR